MKRSWSIFWGAVLALLFLWTFRAEAQTVELTFSVQGRVQARNGQEVDTQRRMAIVVRIRHVSGDPDVTTTVDSTASWTTRGGDASESTMHFGTYTVEVQPEGTYRFWMEFFQVEELVDGTWETAVDPTPAYSPLVQIWIPPWDELIGSGDGPYLNGEIVDWAGDVNAITPIPAGKIAVTFDNFTASADWDTAFPISWGTVKGFQAEAFWRNPIYSE